MLAVLNSMMSCTQQFLILPLVTKVSTRAHKLDFFVHCALVEDKSGAYSFDSLFATVTDDETDMNGHKFFLVQSKRIIPQASSLSRIHGTLGIHCCTREFSIVASCSKWSTNTERGTTASLVDQLIHVVENIFLRAKSSRCIASCFLAQRECRQEITPVYFPPTCEHSL